jgi:hypothetical protein
VRTLVSCCLSCFFASLIRPPLCLMSSCFPSTVRAPRSTRISSSNGHTVSRFALRLWLDLHTWVRLNEAATFHWWRHPLSAHNDSAFHSNCVTQGRVISSSCRITVSQRLHKPNSKSSSAPLASSLVPWTRPSVLMSSLSTERRLL